MRVAAPRRDRVAGDAVATEVARDDARHAGDAGLRRAVVRLAGVARQAGRWSEVDDAAVALLAHEDGRRLDHVEVALEVASITASHSSGVMLKIMRSRRMPATLTSDVEPPEVVERGLDDALAAVRGRRRYRSSPLPRRPRALISSTTSSAGPASCRCRPGRRPGRPRRPWRPPRPASRCRGRCHDRRP